MIINLHIKPLTLATAIPWTFTIIFVSTKESNHQISVQDMAELFVTNHPFSYANKYATFIP